MRTQTAAPAANNNSRFQKSGKEYRCERYLMAGRIWFGTSSF
jgi:hypothetical protein